MRATSVRPHVASMKLTGMTLCHQGFGKVPHSKGKSTRLVLLCSAPADHLLILCNSQTHAGKCLLAQSIPPSDVLTLKTLVDSAADAGSESSASPHETSGLAAFGEAYPSFNDLHPTEAGPSSLGGALAKSGPDASGPGPLLFEQIATEINNGSIHAHPAGGHLGHAKGVNVAQAGAAFREPQVPTSEPAPWPSQHPQARQPPQEASSDFVPWSKFWDDLPSTNTGNRHTPTNGTLASAFVRQPDKAATTLGIPQGTTGMSIPAPPQPLQKLPPRERDTPNHLFLQHPLHSQPQPNASPHERVAQLGGPGLRSETSTSAQGREPSSASNPPSGADSFRSASPDYSITSSPRAPPPMKRKRTAQDEEHGRPAAISKRASSGMAVASERASPAASHASVKDSVRIVHATVLPNVKGRTVSGHNGDEHSTAQESVDAADEQPCSVSIPFFSRWPLSSVVQCIMIQLQQQEETLLRARRCALSASPGGSDADGDGNLTPSIASFPSMHLTYANGGLSACADVDMWLFRTRTGPEAPIHAPILLHTRGQARKEPAGNILEDGDQIVVMR